IYLQSGGSITTLNGMNFVPEVDLSDAAAARDLVAGRQYELFQLVVRHTQTIGTGACPGCALPASFTADFIWLFTAAGGGLGTSFFGSATWQSPATICHTVTPALKSTWGGIKSLYR